MSTLYSPDPVVEAATRLYGSIHDQRDDANRLRDLTEAEMYYVGEYLSIRDRHDHYLGSAKKQYGDVSPTYCAIKEASDKQRVKELRKAIAEYSSWEDLE